MASTEGPPSLAGKSEEEAMQFARGLQSRLLLAEEGNEQYMEAMLCVKAWAVEVGESHPATLSLALGIVESLLRRGGEEDLHKATAMLQGTGEAIYGAIEAGTPATIECGFRFAEALAAVGGLDEAAAVGKQLHSTMTASALHKGKEPTEVFGTLYPTVVAFVGQAMFGDDIEETGKYFREALGAVRSMKEKPPPGTKEEELDRALYSALVSLGEFIGETGLGAPGEDLALLEEAHELAKELCKTAPSIILDSSAELAKLYSSMGRTLDASELLEGVYKFAEEHFAKDSHVYIASKANYGSLLVELNEHDRALEILNDVKPCIVQTKDAPMVLQALAVIYATRGSVDEAAQCHADAVTSTRNHFGEKSNEMVEALRSQAAFLLAAERTDAAVGVVNRALALSEDIGYSPTQLVDLRLTAARILQEAGDISGARQHVLFALKERMEALGRRHPLVASILYRQATIEQEEDPSLAVELLREAVSINKEAYGEEAHSDTAEMMQALAEALQEVDNEDEESRTAEAVQLLRKVADMCCALSGKSHPETVQARMGIVEVLRNSGDLMQAIREAQQLVASLEQADAETLASGVLCLAETYGMVGDSAQQALTIALAIQALQKLDRPSPLLVLAHRQLSEASDTEESALATQMQAVAVAKQVYGPESLMTAEEMHISAPLLLALDRAPEAVTCMQEVLALRRANNVGARGISETCLGLAIAHSTAGDQVRAATTYEEAYDLIKDSSEPEVLIPVLTNYGEFLISKEDGKERGIGFLLRALPLAGELGDFETLLNIPLQLFDDLDDEPARWRAAFDEAWEAVEEDWDDVTAELPELSGQFFGAYQAVKAASQGRVTKAAV
mmetsp:Transcript_743/g.2673  ORF Transcript_743/g.2673 Transcript_743/m.2673 type:complete len:852 (+) Transcript_743:56-2611(+)